MITFNKIGSIMNKAMQIFIYLRHRITNFYMYLIGKIMKAEHFATIFMKICEFIRKLKRFKKPNDMSPNKVVNPK